MTVSFRITLATLGFSIFLSGCGPQNEEATVVYADPETVVAWMNEVYAPNLDWADAVKVSEDEERIEIWSQSGDLLGFARLKDVRRPESQPPFFVVLDPGHLGGEWGPMEHRHFKIDDGPVFQEGDVVLRVAQRVRELLVDEAIDIVLTREGDRPATKKRADDFYEKARAAILGNDAGSKDAISQDQQDQIKSLAERLFYRSAEIEARARVLNAGPRPDLVVCIHINGTSWPAPEKFTLVDENNLHVLVHGTYMRGELDSDAARLELLQKMAHGDFVQEMAAAEIFTRHLKEATHLPAYTYTGDNATQVDQEGYIWARNLAANRRFEAPVVFLEPYVANSVAAYTHFAAGDYEGYREIDGRQRLSMVEEYAQAIAAALREWSDR